MGKTKKVGICGKFGARYGLSIRRKILKVEERKSNICPYCKKNQLKRPASGIWVCGSCGVKFAGGTHIAQQVEGVVE
jgi:large subunit ribosomal protein L37Ae